MRMVMMGTGPFGVPTFKALLASCHTVEALITQPARPAKGRRDAASSPMRAAAVAAHVPVHDPERVNDPECVALLQRLAPDLLVVCDYGQILRPDVLATARLGAINLHGSLLPRYRGAAPVQWAICHGEETTGVTVFRITAGLDSGPILTERSARIEADDDAPRLEARLAELGAGAVLDAIDGLAAWDGRSPLGTPQDPALATRAPRFQREDGRIDWRRPARAIRDRVRGLTPWPGSFTFWHGGIGEPVRLLIQRVGLPEGPSDGEAGRVVRVERDRCWVGAGDGRAVALERLQAAGKSSMDVADFLRGHPVRVGDRME
ncbi:MAG: methionyl-tRNA formyltransferase [Planctomycetes bacterium]|nr:methionyl-tRNA formyltransferase [Planctomycetota bacterium]